MYAHLLHLKITFDSEKKKKKENIHILQHSCIHWSAVVSIMCLNEAIVQRQFIFISAP